MGSAEKRGARRRGMAGRYAGKREGYPIDFISLLPGIAEMSTISMSYYL